MMIEIAKDKIRNLISIKHYFLINKFISQIFAFLQIKNYFFVHFASD